jgi:hypothetical protein
MPRQMYVLDVEFMGAGLLTGNWEEANGYIHSELYIDGCVGCLHAEVTEYESC